MYVNGNEKGNVLTRQTNNSLNYRYIPYIKVYIESSTCKLVRADMEFVIECFFKH